MLESHVAQQDHISTPVFESVDISNQGRTVVNGRTFVVENMVCAPMIAPPSVSATSCGQQLYAGITSHNQASDADSIHQSSHGIQLKPSQPAPALVNAVISSHQNFPGGLLAPLDVTSHQQAPAPTITVPLSLPPILSQSVNQIACDVVPT